MVREIALDIDVTDAAGLGEPAHVRAVVTLPDPATPGAGTVLCLAKPGGGYSTGYYTCDLPGPAHGLGGQAAWHAARGWIFAALDTLGCGASSRHDPDRLDFAAVCAAAVAAEQEIALRLANGVLLPGYPPVCDPAIVGMGQSMGAGLAIYQQARALCYHGIAVLGFSAIHSHPLTPPGETHIVVPWYPRDEARGPSARPLNAAALARATAGGPQGAAWKSIAWGFHYDDVADAVVEQDMLHYEALSQGAAGHGEDASSQQPWNGDTTLGTLSRSALTPGVVAAEAAAIDVPVLCAMGVRDLVPHPADEPRAYRCAASIDLFVCPRMGHMHNFAGTRELLWQRIHAFGQWCAAARGLDAGAA